MTGSFKFSVTEISNGTKESKDDGTSLCFRSFRLVMMNEVEFRKGKSSHKQTRDSGGGIGICPCSSS